MILVDVSGLEKEGTRLATIDAYTQGWNDCVDRVMSLPQYKHIEWALCERTSDLPSSGTTCLATVECGGEKHVIITQFDHGTGWSNLEHGERVVSWLPLPDPYDGWTVLS